MNESKRPLETMVRPSPIAIVTGAGSGIGRHVALALLEESFTVVLAGRRAQALEETVRLAGSRTSHAVPVTCDVTDPASVRALFSQVRARYLRLDLLFNNAGINIPPVPLDEVTMDQWRSVVDTNLTGAFLCIQEAFRLMKHQDPPGGRIINNGSISAHAPRPHSIAYTATKHAMTGLTKSTMLDGRKYNIACGQIDIGNAETEIAADMKQGVPQADGSIAIEPTIDVRHVAQAVVHMAKLPLDANVPFVTLMATGMPYAGRG